MKQAKLPIGFFAGEKFYVNPKYINVDNNGEVWIQEDCIKHDLSDGRFPLVEVMFVCGEYHLYYNGPYRWVKEERLSDHTYLPVTTFNSREITW
jgi:hypothetical protein